MHNHALAEPRVHANWRGASRPHRPLPPAPEPTVEELIAEGRGWAAEGCWDTAHAAYALAVARNPGSSVGWFHKGSSLGALSRWSEALAAYDEALARDPACAPAWYNKGLILEDRGRLAEGLAAYNRALQIDPLAAEVWFSKGLALEGDRQPARAEACFIRATRFGHDAAAGLLARTRAAALTAATAALRTPPLTPREHAARWYERGRCLAHLNRHAEAVEAFDCALTLDATAAAGCGRADSLTALGRYEEAYRAYSETLALDPTYPAAWHAEGQRQARLGRWEAALVAYEHALAGDPGRTAAWIDKAVCLQHLGRATDAVRACDHALADDPAAAAAWFAKGELRALSGQMPEALHCLAQAQRLGHPQAERVSTRLRDASPATARVVASGLRELKRVGSARSTSPRAAPAPPSAGPADPWAPLPAETTDVADLQAENHRLRKEYERLAAAMLTVLGLDGVSDSVPVRGAYAELQQRWMKAMGILASAAGLYDARPSERS